MVADERIQWDRLLEYVEEKRIVPIVGPDLLLLGTDAGEILLDRHIAERLCRYLTIPSDVLNPDFNLNDVACHYLRRRGDKRDLYPAVKVIWKQVREQILVPEALKKLASITDFNFFLYMSFDSLLVDAINEVRHCGKRETQALAYSPEGVNDLPSPLYQLGRPTVYHLFGKVSATLDYVITEEDVLEFLYCLRTTTKKPSTLLEELMSTNLLIIGCSFPNWLTRFFIRTLSSQRLFSDRTKGEFIADNMTRLDHRLVTFLDQCRSVVFEFGGAIDFVNELYSRWVRRRAADTEGVADGATAESVETISVVGTMEEGAIFLSFAEEDREIVRSFRKELEERGLDTWFDERDIEPGEVWEREIRRNVRNCSLFFAFVSENARKRREGYFRKEWQWAQERSLEIDEEVTPFIHPIILGSTPRGAEGIPDFLWARQYVRFRDGKPTEEFLKNTKATIRKIRMRKAGKLP